MVRMNATGKGWAVVAGLVASLLAGGCRKPPSGGTAVAGTSASGTASAATGPAGDGCAPGCVAHPGRYCGGAAPPPGLLERLAATKTCVCDDCARDEDCTAEGGGRCQLVAAYACEDDEKRMCVYPSSDCHAGCAAGTSCLHFGKAPPRCSAPEPPRP